MPRMTNLPNLPNLPKLPKLPKLWNLSKLWTLPKLPKLWKKPVFTMMVLVLPFGYQPDNPDSSAMSIGVYGGMGQAVAVLRDCSGRISETAPYEFREGAVAVAFSQVSGDARVLTGIKGGWLRADDVLTDSKDDEEKYRDRRSSYVNPNVSVEGVYTGAGFGLLFGDVPLFAEDVTLDPNAKQRVDVGMTGHLRAGSLSEVYFLLSLNETLPLYSGGGLFNAGVGYPVGSDVRLFTGFALGVQEKPGFVQQATISIPRQPVQLHLAGRIGAPNDRDENSGSVGITWSSHLNR